MLLVAGGELGTEEPNPSCTRQGQLISREQIEELITATRRRTVTAHDGKGGISGAKQALNLEMFDNHKIKM